MTSIRLLQVTTIAETLEAFLLPFAEHFRSAGWTVDAVSNNTFSNAACVDAFDRVHEVAWSRNPAHPRNLLAVSAMRRLLERSSYDLIHVHTPVAAFVSRAAAVRIRPRVPVVYTAHGFHFHEGGNPLLNTAFATLERIAGPWTDHLVTINRADFDAAIERRLVPTSKLTLIPGIGFDAAAFRRKAEEAPASAELKKSIGLRADTKVILMVAEFTPNKRHVDAVKALAQLGGTDAHLVLVGKGDTIASVESLARELGVGERVHILGYRRDVPQLMTIADALLLLSEREGLPRSVMEGMALGIPIVGTHIRGVADLLGDGAGILVPVGRPDLVAGYLAEILAGGGEVDERVRKATSRLETYSLEAVLAEYESVYEKTLST